ncbi:tetratricopeptide repeat protein, partial [Orientia tsutsugamushi]
MKNVCKKLALILSLILLNTPAVPAEQSIQQDLIQDRTVLAKEYFNIGSSFLKLKKYQDAIENFDIAIKYDPSYASAYNSKGIALDGFGKPLEAIENFNIAIKYNTSYASAYNNKAVSYIDQIGIKFYSLRFKKWMHLNAQDFLHEFYTGKHGFKIQQLWEFLINSALLEG